MDWILLRSLVLLEHLAVLINGLEVELATSAPDRFSDSVSLEEYDEYEENKKYKKCTEVNHQLFTLI